MTDKNLIKKIGKISQTYRQQLGVPQTEMAKRYNTSQKNLSAFENGKSNNIMYIFFYCDLCGLPYMFDINDIWRKSKIEGF